MTDKISEAFEKALDSLESAGDLDLVPDAIATFLLVHSAQGVIDNGGYRYFFESNWPKEPPYSKFTEAYAAIGCEAQGAALTRIVATFPFDEPHTKEELRNKYMEENLDEDELEVRGWSDDLCGDQEVWVKLEAFYLQHQDVFGS